ALRHAAPAPRPGACAPRLLIRVETQVLPRLEYRELRSLWCELEELGVDTIYGADHFLDPYDWREGGNVECWSLLAAMAEATEQVELGPLVCAAAFRNAHLLADMARTVDHISDGRVILGIGSGWWRREFYEYGYEWGTPVSRGRVLDETVEKVVYRLAKLIPPP